MIAHQELRERQATSFGALTGDEVCWWAHVIWIDVLWTVSHPLAAGDRGILDEEVDNVSRGQLLELGHGRENRFVLESFLLASIKEPRVKLVSYEGENFLNATQADASEQGVELDGIWIENIWSIP